MNMPWDKPFNISLTIQGMELDAYQLIINERKVGGFSKEKLKQLKLIVDSKGQIFLEF